MHGSNSARHRSTTPHDTHTHPTPYTYLYAVKCRVHAQRFAPLHTPAFTLTGANQVVARPFISLRLHYAYLIPIDKFSDYAPHYACRDPRGAGGRAPAEPSSLLAAPACLAVVVVVTHAYCSCTTHPHQTPHTCL